MLCVLSPRPNKPSKPNRLHPKCSHKNCSNFVVKGIVHGGDGDDNADNVNDDNGDDGCPHNDDNADNSGGSGGSSRSGGRWDDNDCPSSSRPDKSRRGEEEGGSRKGGGDGGGGSKRRASAAPITNEMLVASNLGKIVDKRHTAPATTTTTPAREGGSAIEADCEAVRRITASKIPVGDSASVLSSGTGGEVPPSFPMPQSTVSWS